MGSCMLPHEMPGLDSAGCRWVWGLKGSMGCSGRAKGQGRLCLTVLYTGCSHEISLKKILLLRNICKPPTWFRVSVIVGCGGTLTGEQSIVSVLEIRLTHFLFHSLSNHLICQVESLHLALVFSMSLRPANILLKQRHPSGLRHRKLAVILQLEFIKFS